MEVVIVVIVIVFVATLCRLSHHVLCKMSGDTHKKLGYIKFEITFFICHRLGPRLRCHQKNFTAVFRPVHRYAFSADYYASAISAAFEFLVIHRQQPKAFSCLCAYVDVGWDCFFFRSALKMKSRTCYNWDVVSHHHLNCVAERVFGCAC